MFPIVDKKVKQDADPDGNGGAIDVTLEGKLGLLQRECFNQLLNTTKRLAEENGISNINSIMSIQVSLRIQQAAQLDVQLRCFIFP